MCFPLQGLIQKSQDKWHHRYGWRHKVSASLRVAFIWQAEAILKHLAILGSSVTVTFSIFTVRASTQGPNYKWNNKIMNLSHLAIHRLIKTFLLGWLVSNIPHLCLMDGSFHPILTNLAILCSYINLTHNVITKSCHIWGT